MKRKMKVKTLMYIRTILSLCAGRGNIPTNITTAENLARLDKAIRKEEASSGVDNDPDVRAFRNSGTDTDSEFPVDDEGRKKWDAFCEREVQFQPRVYNMKRLPTSMHPDGPPKDGGNLDALFTHVLITFGQVEV
jgi:hypothetical protein